MSRSSGGAFGSIVGSVAGQLRDGLDSFRLCSSSGGLASGPRSALAFSPQPCTIRTAQQAAAKSGRLRLLIKAVTLRVAAMCKRQFARHQLPPPPPPPPPPDEPPLNPLELPRLDTGVMALEMLLLVGRDKIDSTGKVTLRYLGRVRHIPVG